MLKSLGLAYTYREYRDDPLDAGEIVAVLAKLQMSPREILRPKEAKAFGLAADLDDAGVIAAMAKEPTLVQRPIAILGDRAVLARPADLLDAFLNE